ncbi:hypothetical protein O3681_07400 [Neisseria sp. 27098_8_158]|mgnify:CR=1 FL=1|uniref:hypothetical protein n=1 Tax=Neisseria sp. 27098_8_158 TaxID=3003680 RepID=UPI00352DC4EC
MTSGVDFNKKGFVASVQNKETFGRVLIENNAYNNETKEFDKTKVNALMPADSDDVKKLDLALQYLQQNEKANSLIQNASDMGIHIVIFKEGDNTFYPLRPNNTDGIIFWNPNQSAEIFSEINGKKVSLGVQSAANVLFHELVHATDPNLAKSDVEMDSYNKPFASDDVKHKFYNAPEYLAVTMSNEIVSKFHNEPIRPDYIGDSMFVSVPNPINSQTNHYDQDGNLIGKTVKTYDEKNETIKTVNTDYLRQDERGLPVESETVTDINGEPVKQIQDKSSFNYNLPDWNNLNGSDLYAAVLSADSSQLDMLGKSLAQSEEGQRMLRQGENLLAEYKEQQELERQQELVHSSRAMVRTL